MSHKLSKFSSFLLIMLSVNIFIINIDNIDSSNYENKFLAINDDKKFVTSYYFDYSSSNELFLVYNEKDGPDSLLKLMSSDDYYQWNKTAETIIRDNSSITFFGEPSITAYSNELFVVSLYSKSAENGIIFLSRGITESIWDQAIIESSSSYLIKETMIQETFANDSIWLSWKDNREGSYNIYGKIYNLTADKWGSTLLISSNSGLPCFDGDFYVDSKGDCHFVWAEGNESSEQIKYRKAFLNGSLSAIDTLTDGLTSCREPTVTIDGSNSINVFWTNYTVEDPGLDFGTINIQTSVLAFNSSWTHPLEVAPYIPLERPPGGESDAQVPAVAYNSLTDELWLAYEIREQYLNHFGIDIRHREDSTWENGERVSLIINPTISPHLKADSAGNLHCMWLDSRSGDYRVYQRIKFLDGHWSDEILVTILTQNSGQLFIYILIIIGVLVVSLPVALLNILRSRKERKLVERKINDLYE